MKKLMIVFLIVLTSCEENPLTSLDKDDTPESQWFEVIQFINMKEYQKAIDLLDDIPDEIKLKRENLVRHSSAYAGLCGLDLLSLLDNSDGLAGLTPLSFLMTHFTEPTPEKISACQTAVEIIEDNASENASDRNSEENIAAMAYYMMSIGLFLNSNFDQDSDGIIDTTADTCNAAQMNDVQASFLGSYLTKMFKSSSNITDVEILNEIQDEVQAGCNNLEGMSPALNFCNKIDPTSFTVDEINGVRSIVQEGVIFGIGSCTNSPKDLANCICQ